jgi:hypothetical protein
MNWGWKIAIVYISFAAMTVTFVVLASMKKVNLVEEDYYEKEIKYQDQIDRIKNTVASEDVFDILYTPTSQELSMQYSGAGTLVGEIQFFRPSDEGQDMLVPLNLDQTGQQKFNTEKLLKGLWVVKVTWETEGTSFYKSQQIHIQ